MDSSYLRWMPRMYNWDAENPLQPVMLITRPVAPSHNWIHGASYHCVKKNQWLRTLVIQSLNHMTCIIISIWLCCEQHLTQDHCSEIEVSVSAQSSNTMTSWWYRGAIEWMISEFIPRNVALDKRGHFTIEKSIPKRPWQDLLGANSNYNTTVENLTRVGTIPVKKENTNAKNQ